MGLFHAFLDDKDNRDFRRRAGGATVSAAACTPPDRRRPPGVLHGNRTYLLMKEDGQINEALSISAGLDYPGIGPSMRGSPTVGRITFLSGPTNEGAQRLQLLSKLEASFPRSNRAHAIAKVLGSGAAKSPRTTYGGQSLRPRRQGPRFGGRHLEKESAMTTRTTAAFAGAEQEEGRARS